MCWASEERAPSGCHESSVPLSLPSPRLQNPHCAPKSTQACTIRSSAHGRCLASAPESQPSLHRLASTSVGVLFRMQHTLSHRVGVRFPGQPIKALFCSICSVCTTVTLCGSERLEVRAESCAALRLWEKMPNPGSVSTPAQDPACWDLIF